MSSLISIIIPVYNRGWQLQRALDSLVRQTDADFEVIVCDDGSREDIRAVVEPYQRNLNLQYCRIDNSGGPARPRNVAASRASGVWLSFLDSDDWWDDDRIAVVKAALNDGADLLYHQLRVVCAEGLKNPRERRKVIGDPLRGDALRHMFLFGNPIPNSATLLRRSWFEKIGGMSEDKSLVALEDFDAWLRVAEAGGCVRFLDRALGSYWVGEDAISAVSPALVQRNVALYERHSVHIPDAIRECTVAANNYRIGSLLLRSGKSSVDAREYFQAWWRLPVIGMKARGLFRYIATYL